MSEDRVSLNSDGGWLGPDYATDLLDEIIMDNALIHFEMSDDSSAYMTVTSPSRQVFVRFHARATTRAERRQILTRSGDTLRDHVAALIPRWAGGRTVWSAPLWRRPWFTLTSWQEARRSARAVFCADLEQDEEL